MFVEFTTLIVLQQLDTFKDRPLMLVNFGSGLLSVRKGPCLLGITTETICELAGFTGSNMNSAISGLPQHEFFFQASAFSRLRFAYVQRGAVVRQNGDARGIEERGLRFNNTSVVFCFSARDIENSYLFFAAVE